MSTAPLSLARTDYYAITDEARAMHPVWARQTPGAVVMAQAIRDEHRGGTRIAVAVQAVRAARPATRDRALAVLALILGD